MNQINIGLEFILILKHMPIKDHVHLLNMVVPHLKLLLLSITNLSKAIYKAFLYKLLLHSACRSDSRFSSIFSL